jgi:3-phenylpropionate/trans-cinnamate dioxygenase ferredoxin reductase component
MADRTFVIVGAGLTGAKAAEELRKEGFDGGDVTDAWHPFHARRVRVEQWADTLDQGPAAARAMLGRDLSYDRIPYLFSDQDEVGMEYSGFATERDEVILRADPAGSGFLAFGLKNGCVGAGRNVNPWNVNAHLPALIRPRRGVDAGVLADLDTPLEALARQAATGGSR